MSKTPLAEIVAAAAARFDKRPAYRASIAARAELEHRGKVRHYKSGTRWCVWRWSLVPSDFIRRLHIVKTPWFAVVLHWIKKPDEEPWLHDHPVTFLSLILKGWYKEKRVVAQEDRSGRRKWWNFIRAATYDRHTITECDPETLTLCFMGPVRRQWGYHTDDGWKFWKDYNKEVYG